MEGLVNHSRNVMFMDFLHKWKKNRIFQFLLGKKNSNNNHEVKMRTWEGSSAVLICPLTATALI